MTVFYLKYDKEKNKYYLGLENREISINKKEYEDLKAVFDLAQLAQMLKNFIEN